MFLYTTKKICHMGKLYGLTLRSHAKFHLHRSKVKVIMTDYVKNIKIIIAKKTELVTGFQNLCVEAS